MNRLKSGGGWPAVKYGLKIANQVGWGRLWRAVNSRNACKTCALGMGGQRGGMRNEAGHWPEICKKSLQAMAADMQEGIPPEFFQQQGFAELQLLTPRELESAGRLVQPMYAGPGDDGYRIVTWDDAIARIVAHMQKTSPDESFFYASGRSSNEAGFLLQLFARIYGSNHVNNCSYYCHEASGVGLTGAFGSGTATIQLEDVENTDLLFLIGGNPASNHPRLLRTMMNIRRRGGHIIVINPVVETGLVRFSVPSNVRSLLFGSEIASEYVQPHIGGDIALMTGIAKVLLDKGAVDRGFIESATDGWADFQASVRDTPWDRITELSGVARSAIERIADMYAAAKSTVFSWTMGITHHAYGVDNVRMIANLAMMRGMVGRRDAGMLPIRGHSNVQGMGSVGVTPKLKQAIYDRLASEHGIHAPTTEGYDTMRCMEAAAHGEMKQGWCLGGNLYGSNPDSVFAGSALNNVNMLLYMSTTLNTGHAWGRGRETIVLPVLARDEEPQPTSQESMFNYVRFSDGGKPRHFGPRSEVSTIAAIAHGVLGGDGPVDWQSMEQCATIRTMISGVVPGFEKLGTIDETRGEFQVGGRIFHEPQFPTSSGRAAFLVVEMPRIEQADDQLRLMTVRSEGQFNTVVYEEEDIYRAQERRDVILLNVADISRMGLRKDQKVTVESDTGERKGILVREFDIRAGSALMYYPEANVLIPRTVDPKSRTPAYKMVLIRIKPQE